MNKISDVSNQSEKENENIPQFVNATDASLFDDSSDITFKDTLNTNNTEDLIKDTPSTNKLSTPTTNTNKTTNYFNCYKLSYSMNKQETTNNYALHNYINNDEFDDDAVDDNNDDTITTSNDELDNDDDDEDDDDDDDPTTTDDSQFSNLSGLSELSGQEWKPMTKPLNWVQKQIHSGADPRELLSHIYNGSEISPDLNDLTLWKILASILSEPPRREKLKTINTLNDVLNLLKISKNIIILTGAGVSVSCGIPDFRSNDGIYSRLAKDFPDLPDPQAMFDINYFSKDPRPFFKFAREIYPGQFKPSPCHRFIKLLELKNKLLRNYTQNIDTLEKIANIDNVIECHGSFATASCTKCKYKQSAESIRKDIFAQKIPLCPKCQPIDSTTIINNDNDKRLFSVNVNNKIQIESNYYRDLVKNGIMKPDIVFFGEGLPDAFHTAMGNDKDKCDLLIVIGSSLKVRPVALVPSSIPANVPQILINRERLNHLEFDVELLGDSDVIINQLCHLLGDDWKNICWNGNVLEESLQLKSINKQLYTGENIALSSSVTNKTKILNLDVSSQSKKSPILTHNSSSNSSSISDNSSSSTINYIGYSDSGFDSSSSVNSSTTTPAIIKISNTDETLTKTTSNNNDLILSSYQPKDNLEKSSINQEKISESNTENNFFKNSLIRSQDDAQNKCDNLTISDINKIDKALDSEYDNNDTADNINSEIIIKNSHNDVNLTTTASSSSSWLKKSNLYTSAAERLLPNTYYCHKSTCSYIFEGAQVYLSSDEESEDDDDDDNITDNCNNEMSSSKIQDKICNNIEKKSSSESTTSNTSNICGDNNKTNSEKFSLSNISLKRSALCISNDDDDEEGNELVPSSFKFKKR